MVVSSLLSAQSGTKPRLDGVPAATEASTWATSALDGRSSGRFSRHRAINASTAEGRPSTCGSGSGSVYWWARSSAVVVPTSHGS